MLLKYCVRFCEILGSVAQVRLWRRFCREQVTFVAVHNSDQATLNPKPQTLSPLNPKPVI